VTVALPALVPFLKKVMPLFVMVAMPLVSALTTLNVPPAFTVAAPWMAPALTAVPSCSVPPLIVVPPL